MSVAPVPARAPGPRSGGVVIHEDEALRIGLLEGTNDRLVIAFTGRGLGHGAIPAEEFAVAARGDGNSIVFVADKKMLWYQSEATEAAILSEVQAIIDRLQPASIVTIGNSMGGFGAIRFAAPLGAKAAIAFDPQFSVKPGVVPGETRYGASARRIGSFRIESLADQFAPGVSYFVIHGIDAEQRQAAAFPEGPGLNHYLLDDTPHGTARALGRAGAIEPLLDAAFAGESEAARSVIEEAGGIPRGEVDLAPTTNRWSDARFVEIGWWLFVICALFFIWGALRAGDMIGFLGSLTFLAANIAFMIPIYRKKEDDQ